MKLIYKGEVLMNGETYSAEETRIGTWIDGKPLYRRILNGVFPSAINTWIYWETLVDNVETIVALRGVIHDSINGIYYQIPDGDTVVGYYSNLKKVGACSYVTGYLNLPAFVIVEYTKTTD